jgi:hypothetical protein
VGSQILRVDLVKAGIQTKSALFKGAHFLEAQGHVVHGDLDQETVFRVLLELETVEEGLGFL